jgi:cytochrome b subunit of formate dehydrogenase
MRTGIEIFLLALMVCCLAAGAASPSIAAADVSGPNARCAACHEDAAYRKAFPVSVHGNNGCTSCHKVGDIAKHTRGDEKPAMVDCGACHGDISRNYAQDAHYLKLDFRCTDCHRGIHALQKSQRSRAAVVTKCSECHDKQDYVAKGHGAAVLRGNNDAASCADCHGLHGVRALREGDGPLPAEAKMHFMPKCAACHSDPELAKRNNLNPKVVKEYEETYHGKVSKVGYPARVAGCADCHSSHNILKPDNPQSAFSPQGRAAMCGKCHRGFNPRFANFIAHPDYENPKKHPALYVTSIFMLLLIVGVFIFFWTHTVLWWRKSYWETCLGKKTGPDKTGPAECETEQVQRFRPLFRVMHVLLIISFFMLVMTGIPLKYAGADWARPLISFWGGSPAAGVFHRIAASILSALFLYTIWLSLKFLFPKGQVKGWLGRLFGPDSLFPSLKDLRDIRDMFLWFFNRGEMPKLDRWTYWEKFDFLAVFWGMFAIGLSGLMLWFPEKFSYIFPGWFLNIAALVHSEEALLAALFIFTVHFFNNHLVPNKFPLEPNVFTGRQTLEQLEHERPLEYERLKASGELDKLRRPAPGPKEMLIWRIFGIGSWLLGVFLTVLLVWAIVL